jgi:hypothetical protein
MDEDKEAALYVDDNGALSGPLFRGPFVSACKMAWAMEPTARTYVRIETASHIYGAGQLEDMRHRGQTEL